tara:strand:- start:338 stop:1459 length:1122 start_codon:yes stop_codon:yes gene_type:complete
MKKKKRIAKGHDKKNLIPERSWKSFVKLAFFLYLFILAIQLIKKASGLIAPDARQFIFSNLSPLKAIAAGWFSTSIAQSSGAVSSLAVTFVGNGLIDLPIAVYILIGASMGTTITALIISLITVSKKKKDFRHGFEIALCYSIYSFILVFIVFFLEYFFALFSRLSFYLATLFQGNFSYLKVPDVVDVATGLIVKPIISNNHIVLTFLVAFLILIFALKFISRSVVEVMGGEVKAKNFINKYFDSPVKAYFMGVILTAIVFSSSITISLLVPLAVGGLIGLRRSIPFILGADLGTFTDTFLVSLIIGDTHAIAAAFSYALFAIVGAIIFLPNTNFLFRVTKYTSKKLIKISRKKAFYVLLFFVLIPLGIIVFF